MAATSRTSKLSVRSIVSALYWQAVTVAAYRITVMNKMWGIAWKPRVDQKLCMVFYQGEVLEIWSFHHPGSKILGLNLQFWVRPWRFWALQYYYLDCPSFFKSPIILDIAIMSWVIPGYPLLCTNSQTMMAVMNYMTVCICLSLRTQRKCLLRTKCPKYLLWFSSLITRWRYG